VSLDRTHFRVTYRFADLLVGAPPRTDEERPSPLTDEERELLYGPMRKPQVPVDDVETPAEVPDPQPARRRSFARGVVRVVSTLLMLVAIAFLLLVTVGPRFLPFQSFYIRTGSMRPGIPVGALVVATREPAANLHVGDIIVFDRPGAPGDMVTHRIFAIEDSPSGPQFVTKGDANGLPDPWRVAATGDGWKYKFSVRYAGYAVGYAQVLLAGTGPRGALVIVCTVLALFMIWRVPTSDPERPTTDAVV
jgi:signal peptidase I